MSDREFKRAAMLRRVVLGELPIMDAAPLMGVSYRAQRLAPEAYRTAVLALVRLHNGEAAPRGPGQRFGPTLAAEHLWIDHGVLVPVKTLTRRMQGAELRRQVRRAKPRHQRRERKAHFGELPARPLVPAPSVQCTSNQAAMSEGAATHARPVSVSRDLRPA